MTQSNNQAASNKVCPVCNSENYPDAGTCLTCGASLHEDTTRMTQTEPLERSDHIQHYLQLYTDSILFFVMDEKIPVLVKNTVDIITLGRNDPGSPNYHMDLSVYGALLLGVSRIHARMTTSNQTFMVEDLNSTNGTLLNGIRLVSGLSYMLRNGDQLELGRMKLQMFFSEPRTEGESIYLVNTMSRTEDISRHSLTLKDMSWFLSPYLKLIDDLQTQLNRMQNRKSGSVGFKSLSLTKTHGIQVFLDGAAGAVDILLKVIMPARVQLRDILESTSPELDRHSRLLAEKCVLHCIKDATGTMTENYIYQCMPLMKALLTAPFDVLLYEERHS